MTSSVVARHPSRSRLRTAALLVAGAVVALNAVVGVVLGWVGWAIVRRRARDPRRVLAVLVPVMTVLSLVPNTLLLVFGFIPGTTVVGVGGLMVMHLVVCGGRRSGLRAGVAGAVKIDPS